MWANNLEFGEVEDLVNRDVVRSRKRPRAMINVICRREDITREDLAEAMGVTRTTIQNWSGSRCDPRQEHRSVLELLARGKLAVVEDDRVEFHLAEPTDEDRENWKAVFARWKREVEWIGHSLGE